MIPRTLTAAAMLAAFALILAAMVKLLAAVNVVTNWAV